MVGQKESEEKNPSHQQSPNHQSQGEFFKASLFIIIEYIFNSCREKDGHHGWIFGFTSWGIFFELVKFCNDIDAHVTANHSKSACRIVMLIIEYCPD